MEADFCLAAPEKAFISGFPGIFNTDQGVQFTSAAFTGMLKEKEINISMDGRGRAMDNIFTERLWRSLKYEEVYIRDYHLPVILLSQPQGCTCTFLKKVSQELI